MILRKSKLLIWQVANWEYHGGARFRFTSAQARERGNLRQARTAVLRDVDDSGLEQNASLARHPGRPWRPKPERVPEYVAKHYLTPSVEELIEDVLHHYKTNVWPRVKSIIASQTNDPSSNGIVLEGSAIWPDFAPHLDLKTINALWLTATEETFRNRIHAESSYNSKTPRERKMIDKFLARTLAYNTRMVKVVQQRGFILLDVRDHDIKKLAQRCRSELGIDTSIVHATTASSTRADDPHPNAQTNWRTLTYGRA